MRILILANSDLGLYNFRKELVQELINSGNDVFISLPYGEKVDLLKKMGCKFIETPIDRRGVNPFKDFKLLIKYWKIINECNPDKIITYTIKPNIYGGIISRLKKKSLYVNITGLGTVFQKKNIITKLVILLYKIALKDARCIFFQNALNKLTFEQNHLNTNNSLLIPGSGVNLDQYKYIDYPQSDTIEFFFIARVMKEKGIEEFIKVAQYCKEKNYNAHFHIFGDCEEMYEDRLTKLTDANILTYHGRCNNLSEYQSINHCTIHPSYHEGMSNVLLETAACGRPCICSDIPGCREIVDDGKSGFLFEAKNTQQLIDCVEKFIHLSNEQRKEMGINARHKVEKEFDRNIVVNTYIQKINEL